jgi:hypothetical protein
MIIQRRAAALNDSLIKRPAACAQKPSQGRRRVGYRDTGPTPRPLTREVVVDISGLEIAELAARLLAPMQEPAGNAANCSTDDGVNPRSLRIQAR